LEAGPLITMLRTMTLLASLMWIEDLSWVCTGLHHLCPENLRPPSGLPCLCRPHRRCPSRRHSRSSPLRPLHCCHQRHSVLRRRPSRAPAWAAPLRFADLPANPPLPASPVLPLVPVLLPPPANVPAVPSLAVPLLS
jgi:hypothetical protein